jgi:bifunctional non-homologous end joining protein LigD
VFDVLTLAGRNVMSEPLSVRRELLRTKILPKLGEPIRHCPELNASLAAVIESVRAAGLEGVVAKRLDSAYEPGSRSGAWRKMRINRVQEFVIAGSRLRCAACGNTSGLLPFLPPRRTAGAWRAPIATPKLDPTRFC